MTEENTDEALLLTSEQDKEAWDKLRDELVNKFLNEPYKFISPAEFLY